MKIRVIVEAAKELFFLEDVKNVSFKSCTFYDNKVVYGGGLYITGGSVNLENSIIKDIDLNYSNSSGAGLYVLNCKDLLMKNTVIKNCITNWEGAGLFITEDNSVSGLTSNIRIESCLISENEAKMNGGAALNVNNPTEDNKIHLLLVNSTVYGNKTSTSGQGGAIRFNRAKAGSKVDMVNCTIVGNSLLDTYQNGAGICFMSGAKDIRKGFYNCIIESNTATSSTRKAADISFKYLSENGNDLFVYNSFIGGLINNNDQAAYISIPENKNKIGYNQNELAELATPFDEFIASINAIPLEYNSPGLKHGNAKHLKILNINKDQLGVERKFEDEKCAVGAVEEPTSPPDVESYNYRHFIMYGQSLSTGHEAYPVSMENIEGNYMIGEQIWINYGNKNFDKLNPLKSTIALGYADVSEAPLHGAVNHIRLKMEKEFNDFEDRFIATSAGQSGQPIEALSRESEVNDFYSDFESSLRYGRKIAKQTNSTIQCPALFWLQGEWNYQGHGSGLTPNSRPTADKDKYKELMIRLKENMQSDVMERYQQNEKPLFITYQVGAQYTSGTRMPIGMAQLEASNEYKDIICAGPVYPMTDVGGHLDGNGYRWYGEMLGKVYFKTKIQGEDFKPLQPKKIERKAEEPNKVYLTYHVPEPPLVFDVNTLKKENDYGFNVSLNGRTQTISGFDIVNDSILVITSSADLSTGRLSVSYAGSATRGHGNLRDSDSYQAFFRYENPDKKDENGNFVFDHGSKNSLIPPSGEPKNAAGEVIYEQPYPLYNFSVAFYYEIPVGQAEYKVPQFYGQPYVSNPDIETNDLIRIAQKGKSVFVYLSESGTVFADLYGISGNKIRNFSRVDSSSLESQEYKLDDLPTGIYILKVRTEFGLKSVKISL